MLFRARDERRISLIAGAILFILTLASGVSVYVVMHHQAQASLSRGLQLNLESRTRLIEREITQNMADTVALASRPALREQLALASAYPKNFGAERTLNTTLQNALSIGFSALALYDVSGHEAAHAGAVDGTPEMSVALNLPYRTQLEWDGGLALTTKIDLFKAGRIVGTLLTVKRLPQLMGVLTDLTTLGDSAELILCGAENQHTMQCFPSRNTPHISQHIPQTALMSLALTGRSGFTSSRQERAGESVFAYMPVGALGLGSLLRIDATELYQQPIQQQARYVVPLLLCLIIGGALLLRWQVLPLLHKVVISEARALELNQKLRRNEARIRAVLNHVDEGIVSMTSEGLLRTFNPAAEHIFGYSAEEVVGNNISMVIPELGAGQQDQDLQHYLSSGKAIASGVSREVVGRRKDATTFPIELRVGEVNVEGEHLFIAAIRDIEERKSVEARVIHLANHDTLTNLPNRNLLQDRACQALMQATRQQQRVGIFFIDLDHFKTINDSLGHHIGDRLLQTVAARIRSCVRGDDTVARQGGDEFIVVLPNIKRFEDIGIIAQKLLVALSAPYSIDGAELHTSASIGVSVFPDDGPDVDTLMRNADTAMYYAKSTGRNNFQFFTPKMNQATAERLQIENKLRHALERNEFSLNYQPIVNLATGQVGAAEALLRWSPSGGAIGPDRFIPVAEETGLIVPIGEWVIRAATQERRRWLDQGLTQPRMFVNVSARQFAQKNLVAIIGRILQESDLSPQHLGVEITESLLMDRPDDAVRTLKTLSGMGVQISIDDFGTGYSSLSYLKRFPLDKIKVDRSFVRDIATDPDDAAIVTAIIAMAHSLNTTVVAEGVETEEQLRFLRERGCDEFQGYYFSRPVPGADLIAKMASGMSLASS
jgi:diguanylate cyclase (GGDEF)-like protein/PAS domain S-box-containing protein